MSNGVNIVRVLSLANLRVFCYSVNFLVDFNVFQCFCVWFTLLDFL